MSLDQQLEQAAHLLKQNALQEAEPAIARILSARPHDAGALSLLGSLREKQGRPSEAEQLYRRALTLDPRNASILLSLAYLYYRHSKYPEAIAAFRGAIGIKPDFCEAHLSLATTLHETGAFAEAEESYRNALKCDAALTRAKIGLGAVLNNLSRPAEAEQVLSGIAGESSPILLAAIEHNLALARSNQNDHEGALAHINRSLAHMPDNDGAEHARASMLQLLGRENEAVESYKRAVAANPRNLKAHRDLNLLLYRLRRDDDYLKSYDEAAAQMPDVPEFLLAKASLLLSQERGEEARDIYARVRQNAPDNIEAISGYAIANLNLKNPDEAIKAFQKALELQPDKPNLLNGMGAALLMARQPKKAAMMAEYALSANPYDQTSISVLATALRLFDETRAEDLNGFEKFVQVYDLEPPQGYTDMDAFNRDLNVYLDRLHPDAREYVDQSLRNGTQTTGYFFGAGHDLVERLRMRIEEAVTRYVQSLPAGEKHPLLSRRGACRFAFAGSWSSRLRDCGYHTNHIHPEGWVSSAYYVALPETVADSESKSGWIKFGEPAFDTGLGSPVRRAIQPRPGRLVLFPSYMWHGTVPFRSAQARTTIAFDVVPR
jgi:Tfp pilus assembly protein PilF